jgi:uncharacterized protein (TIGR02996 family)
MPTDEEFKKMRELAYAQFSDEREAVALEILQRYLAHMPDDYHARLLYADCLRIIGRREEAEYEFQRVSFAPKTISYHELHAKLGMLYQDWGKLSEAEEHFAIACGPADSPGWAWILRGANLALMERFDDAAECHRKATKIESRCDRDEAFLNLGLVLRAQAKYEEAADAFRSALELNPDYPAAIEALKSIDGIARSLDLTEKLLLTKSRLTNSQHEFD